MISSLSLPSWGFQDKMKCLNIPEVFCWMEGHLVSCSLRYSPGFPDCGSSTWGSQNEARCVDKLTVMVQIYLVCFCLLLSRLYTRSANSVLCYSWFGLLKALMPYSKHKAGCNASSRQSMLMGRPIVWIKLVSLGNSAAQMWCYSHSHGPTVQSREGDSDVITAGDSLLRCRDGRWCSKSFGITYWQIEIISFAQNNCQEGAGCL